MIRNIEIEGIFCGVLVSDDNGIVVRNPEGYVYRTQSNGKLVATPDAKGTIRYFRTSIKAIAFLLEENAEAIASEVFFKRS